MKLPLCNRAVLTAIALPIAVATFAILIAGCGSDGVASPNVPQADKEAKIRNAMSAAPPSIADEATIMDWPAAAGESMTILHEGSNSWTCMPDMHHTAGNDPMCIDAPWLEFIGALGSKSAPNITQMGFAYMLQANDHPFSNADPFATGPTPDNDWQEGDEGPHLMILIPDLEMLAGLSTDPTNGGPYVMYPGTPYAHIMAPMPLYEPAEKRP